MICKASGAVTSMHKPLYYNDCDTVCTYPNQCYLQHLAKATSHLIRLDCNH